MMIACVALSGCYAPIQCHLYPKHNVMICRASEGRMQRFCKDAVADDGKPIPSDFNIRGCTNRAIRTSMTSWTAPEPETSLHEIGHLIEDMPVQVDNPDGSY